MKLSSLRVDAARTDWVGDIPEMGDLRLKVRSSLCADFRETVSTLRRAVPRGAFNRDGSLPVDISERISGEALHKTILLDWENLTGDDDSVIPYTKETALKLLTDPEYAVFRNAVFWASEFVARGQSEDEAKTLGNSDQPSNGG